MAGAGESPAVDAGDVEFGAGDDVEALPAGDFTGPLDGVTTDRVGCDDDAAAAGYDCDYVLYSCCALC